MQIVALQQRHKAPTIEKLLHEEGLHTTRQGIPVSYTHLTLPTNREV